MKSIQRSSCASVRRRWMASGAFLSAADNFPPVSFAGYRALDVVSKVGAYAWFVAGLLWVATELGVLTTKPRNVEPFVVFFWTASAISMVVAAAAAPRTPAAERWTFVSSSSWGAVGCFCWTASFLSGGTMISFSPATSSPSDEDEGPRDDDDEALPPSSAVASSRVPPSEADSAECGGGDVVVELGGVDKDDEDDDDLRSPHSVVA